MLIFRGVKRKKRRTRLGNKPFLGGLGKGFPEYVLGGALGELFFESFFHFEATENYNLDPVLIFMGPKGAHKL